jgi:hypothetical protein
MLPILHGSTRYFGQMLARLVYCLAGARGLVETYVRRPKSEPSSFLLSMREKLFELTTLTGIVMSPFLLYRHPAFMQVTLTPSIIGILDDNILSEDQPHIIKYYIIK